MANTGTMRFFFCSSRVTPSRAGSRRGMEINVFSLGRWVRLATERVDASKSGGRVDACRFLRDSLEILRSPKPLLLPWKYRRRCCSDCWPMCRFFSSCISVSMKNLSTPSRAENISSEVSMELCGDPPTHDKLVCNFFFPYLEGFPRSPQRSRPLGNISALVNFSTEDRVGLIPPFNHEISSFALIFDCSSWSSGQRIRKWRKNAMLEISNTLFSASTL